MVKRQTRVLLGRLDVVIQEGLQCILRRDPALTVDAIGAGENSLERLVAERAPRVVVVGETVDEAMLTRLRAIRPAVGLVVVAYDPSFVQGTLLLSFGATCLAQDASAGEILAAVRSAGRGTPTFVGSDGVRRSSRSPSAVSSLTPRQAQVFALLTQGQSYEEIAVALHIGYETVRSHTAAICRKLGVKRRQELIGSSHPSARSLDDNSAP